MVDTFRYEKYEYTCTFVAVCCGIHSTLFFPHSLAATKVKTAVVTGSNSTRVILGIVAQAAGVASDVIASLVAAALLEVHFSFVLFQA